MEVLVFKTNVSTEEKVLHVRSHLYLLKEIREWNFDLMDEEFILRIEAENLCPRKVEDVLQSAGYYCCELED